MHFLFEESDVLRTPVECFYFDANHENFPVKPHWHYFAEMIYIIEGCADMYCGENRYIVSEGEMIFFHPRVVHSIHSANGKKLFYAVIKFDINRLNMTSDYAPKLRSIFHSAQKREMEIMFPEGLCAEIKAEEIFMECIREAQGRGYGSDIIVKSRIYELLIRILRIWQRSGFTIDNEIYADDSTPDINNITEYIDSHISEGVTVEEIARECRMSYSYFAKKFLQVYGKTCKEYIEEIRLYKVEELLLFTDFDLTYISNETGYSDCSHMIKSFKKYKGVTPKRFRTEKRAALRT
ncbi:MAG: AraC family transcriptional regulator [Ruminiclostridium sp.]|nr:AraC family transcriptional regulator [Ruminiclostridium sp.]